MLNATYEPLSVVASRRAIVLVLVDKAEVVHASERVFHSERLTIAAPSVIRLRQYVRVPHERSAPLNRRSVFLRDQGECQYCGRAAENIDHVVPRSRGGPHAWDNVVAACRRCNTAKRDRLVSETSLRLRTQPHAPRQMSWVAASVGSVPDPWLPYLGSSVGAA